MKILTIVHELGVRGTPKAAVLFSKAYKELGHEVAVLCYGVEGIRAKALTFAGIPVCYANCSERHKLENIKSWKPDLIHIHGSGAYQKEQVDLLKAVKGSSKCIKTSVFGRVDYHTSHSIVDLHMQISAFNLWRWRGWLGNRKQLGVLVPNPVDLDTFYPISDDERRQVREELGIPADSFLCIHVGFKGTETIFVGFKSLAEKTPNTYLAFVPYESRFDPFFKKLPENIRKRVLKIGEVEDDSKMARLISASDCLLHAANIGETFGYVLAEAQSAGVPVVTLSTPHRDNAQIEVVRHLETGVCVGSKRDFPAAMLKLYSETDLRIRMKINGPRFIAENYAPKQVALLALRAASHLKHENYEKRFYALETDPYLRTRIEKRTFLDLATRLSGRTPIREKVMMRFVLHPLGQRIIRLLRHHELFILGRRVL
jgi:glycosyltransferase involved in cell wall biosynthesis